MGRTNELVLSSLCYFLFANSLRSILSAMDSEAYALSLRRGDVSIVKMRHLRLPSLLVNCMSVAILSNIWERCSLLGKILTFRFFKQINRFVNNVWKLVL